MLLLVSIRLFSRLIRNTDRYKTSLVVKYINCMKLRWPHQLQLITTKELLDYFSVR